LPHFRHRARARLPIELLGALLVGAAACGRAPEPQPVPAPSSAAPVPPPPRGLWVPCEGSQRVLEHAERAGELIDAARALGATDLFVQVYRGGRAWFDSDLADAEPWQRARTAAGGDSLAALIGRAHAAGLRVHAWVNVLSLAGNAKAPLLAALGRDAALVDQDGRSVLDYPGFDVPPPLRRHVRMGTPAVWLDPAAPGVAARLIETFAQLLTRYPELDGLHLDYIRYPDVLPFSPGSRFGVGLDFGHGPKSRARFRAETGLEAPRPPFQLGNADRWDEWRRDQVTTLVRGIADAARRARPGVVVSAAVWAWADRAYLSIGQDWRRWLEDGLLDFAVPMAYTRDQRLFRYQAESLARAPQGAHTWIGIGAWLFANEPAGAALQVEVARRAGAAGDALFSWDALAEAPPLRAALAAAAAEAPDGR
jgi:uncharacterized lipoprotein YddW (UPF0748 family)